MASHKSVWSRLLLKPFLRSTYSDEKWVISANIVKQVIKSERYRPKQKPAGFLKGVPRRLNFLHKLHVVTYVGARFILPALHIVSFWGAPNNLQIIKSTNQIENTHSWNFLDSYLIKKSLLTLFTKLRKYKAQSTFFFTDTEAILNDIVSKSYYAMLRGDKYILIWPLSIPWHIIAIWNNGIQNGSRAGEKF